MQTLFTLEKILSGWRIEQTSCSCGGRYAWLKPRPSGAYEMVGCICHAPNTRLQADAKPLARFVVNVILALRR